MILDSIDLTAEDMSVNWKAEMCAKLRRALRRSKKKEAKVAQKNENETQS